MKKRVAIIKYKVKGVWTYIQIEGDIEEINWENLYIDDEEKEVGK